MSDVITEQLRQYSIGAKVRVLRQAKGIGLAFLIDLFASRFDYGAVGPRLSPAPDLRDAVPEGLPAVIALFMGYVKRHTLRAFAYYRMGLGALVFYVFAG